MIKFRQKEFWIGPALMAATSILGLKQGADAQKEQEEANEEAAREQRRHNRAMEKAAMTNPEALQKDFAAPGSILKTAGGFAKDLIGTQKVLELARFRLGCNDSQLVKDRIKQ